MLPILHERKAKSMNWDAVGAVGEFVGAAAVVISVLYLASQVRTQNRESRIAGAHEIFEAFRNVAISFQDPGNASVMLKAANDYESLEEVERIRVIAIVIPFLRVWEEAYYQHQKGRLDEVMWSSMTMQYADFMAVASYQKVREIRRHVFSEQFRAYVDSIDVGEYRNI